MTGRMDGLAVPEGAEGPDSARASTAFTLKPEDSATSSKGIRSASGLAAAPALYDAASAQRLDAPRTGGPASKRFGLYRDDAENAPSR